MADQTCIVFETFSKLSELIESGRLTHPRLRRRAEDLLKLIKDVSSGRGGPSHLPAMFKALATIANEEPEESSRELVRIVGDPLESHKEIFASHIHTHNCPTGDCDILTPAPCQMACPAGIDVSSYVSLIGQGRYAEAVELIRKDNPFPWVCGLVCTHPCEFVCVRARIDTPIAIKDLKAFAAEKAISDRVYKNPPKAPEMGYKVCVIGAGPAGLTAAYYLALKGYQVTVLEALPYAGGMMMVGIPRYRLPREIIDREVAFIEELGVEFRFNTRLGRHTSMEKLRQEGFEAFFISTGAHASLDLSVKGEKDFPQVIDAITFLRNVSRGDRHVPGKRAAVIGGGNVAIDAARTLIRLGCEDVQLVYRRTRSEMPANVEEVKQAEEEGVRLILLTVPVEVIGNEGKVTGLKCLRAKLAEPDEKGRRRPIPVEGSDHTLEVDAVVTAIGQRIDREGLESLESLRWTKWGTLQADTITSATSVEGIFSGGDLVLGPATVVEAIGAGKLAAEGIDRYLRGLPQPKMPPVPARRMRVELTETSASSKMALHRPEMPLLGPERRRITFQQVELGYDEKTAKQEAKRCLRCDICKRCGKCVTICREKMGIDALQFGYLDSGDPGFTDYRVTAERCILCGACAANCPTGAIALEDKNGERVLSLCGTVLCHEKLEHCEDCGMVIGPARYLDYVKKRTATITEAFGGRLLCDKCIKQLTAQYKSGTTIP
ncbi:MAG: 4Fe-4S ferredoxin iron-sulfur binding domain protein [Deltaproteobacteria bacterium]|nr:4Fe-4S ferredoxin iron-sulfur binding domain protein [Deltaproteobacteria bacterium]